MPPDTEDSVPAGDTDLKSFTQEQIDSIVGRAEKRAAREAAKAAQADFLDSLGVDSVETLKDRLDTLATAEDAQRSEADKAVRRAAEAERKAADRIAQAEARLAEARVTSALVAHMDPAVARRLAPTVRVDPDATDDEIEAVIEELRAEVPGLFQPQERATATAPGTTSQNRTRPTGRTTSASEREAVDSWVENWMSRDSGGNSLPLL